MQAFCRPFLRAYLFSCTRSMLLAGALLFLAPFYAASQDTAPAGRHAFDRSAWRRVTEGLNYPRGDRTVDERASASNRGEQERNGETNRRRWLPGSGSKWGKALVKGLIILGASVILFILLRGLLGLEWAPRKRKLSGPSDLAFNLEQIEEDLEAHDLEPYIRQALSAGRLDVAIRLYYLQTLKELSTRRLIHWKRERTNRDYLNQLRDTDFHPGFAELTQAFERVWYGQYPVSEKAFRQMEGQFNVFLGTIRHSR